MVSGEALRIALARLLVVLGVNTVRFTSGGTGMGLRPVFDLWIVLDVNVRGLWVAAGVDVRNVACGEMCDTTRDAKAGARKSGMVMRLCAPMGRSAAIVCCD